MPNVHIKIKDGDIQSQDEVELLSSDDSSSLVPLGLSYLYINHYLLM